MPEPKWVSSSNLHEDKAEVFKSLIGFSWIGYRNLETLRRELKNPTQNTAQH